MSESRAGSAPGLIVAAPRSGSGKTVVTLGLARALRNRGLVVAPAKTGPDYIDGALLARAAGRPAVNFDPWAMREGRLQDLAQRHGAGADLLLVEGVMGLFDGAVDGTGSTGDLACALGLPVVLVVDAERQAQSVAPLVKGFADWDPRVRIAGVVLNRVAGGRHETMLRRALAAGTIPCLGAIPRRSDLQWPDRHLGLLLPDDSVAFEQLAETAARAVEESLDVEGVLQLARPPAVPKAVPAPLPPLGQHTAIARDDAFAFLYPHLLEGWRAARASISFFSPLQDEGPSVDADAVFLPGGYPELHAGRLAVASRFKAGLGAAAEQGALVYGECGGYMAMGETLTDRDGVTHAMAGLLPVHSRIDRPRRVLGYRRLQLRGPLPWPAELRGHEFHYSSAPFSGLPPLFASTDALGEALEAMGAVSGRVMGSYAHVIDRA